MLIICDAKAEPQRDWILQMKINGIYKEPKLHKEIVNIISLVCTALKQDVHVFVMSVNLLEERLTIHDEDMLLTILVIVFICSKTIGEQSDLKLKHLTAIYKNMTTIHINEYHVSKLERNIFTILLDNMPLTSEVDDLKLFYNTYMEPINLKRGTLNLCLHILQLIYVNKYNFFFDLKQSYIEINMLDIFKNIYTSKFYLSCGIILASFMVTKYENVFDLDGIMNDFSAISEIHKDHYEILSKKIVELVNERFLDESL